MIRPMRTAIFAAIACLSLVLCSAAQAPAPSSATPSATQPVEAQQPAASTATPSATQPVEARQPAPSTATSSAKQPVEAQQPAASSATPSASAQTPAPKPPRTYADMNGAAPAATGTTKHPNHHVPPVWSPFYNAEQGTLPDTSNWRVLHDARNLVVRLAPGSEWKDYAKVQPGMVRYTGTENELSPKQIAFVADYLQLQIEKKLPGVHLGTPAAASGTLTVDVNITDAIVNHYNNLPTVAASMAPARERRSSLQAWVWDAATHKPVACIELIAADEGFEVVWGLRPTGRLRAALRAEADLLTDTLTHIQHKMTTTADEAK